MFWSRFFDNGSTDSERVSCVTYTYTFLLLDPENGAQVGLPSSTHYANCWRRFSRYTSMHYMNGCVVLLSRSTRRCQSMHDHAWTFSKQVIASIIDDSHCGMSDVAFRTPLPIGRLSCYRWHPITSHTVHAVLIDAWQVWAIFGWVGLTFVPRTCFPSDEDLVQ